MTNPSVLAFLARQAPGCRWITSVCTGSFVLAAAGRVTGRQVTTHWSRLDELRTHPVTVRDDGRYIQYDPAPPYAAG